MYLRIWILSNNEEVGLYRQTLNRISNPISQLQVFCFGEKNAQNTVADFSLSFAAVYVKY
jgi:hypothetical protein